MRVDLRGHGESSTAPAYGMKALVGDLRAVTDNLGIADLRDDLAGIRSVPAP